MNRKSSIFAFFIIFILTSQTFPQFRQSSATDSSVAFLPLNRNSSAYFTKQVDALQMFSRQRPNLTGQTADRDEPAELALFGYDLFGREPSDYSSDYADALVLPPNYLLGPGDRVGIYLLGNVQKNIDVLVNVEGKIFLPPAGVIYVWGLSLKEFKKLLSRKLSQYYDNFSVDVMLLQPKKVMVAVVGDVVSPGKYVLSALHTVLDAVITAGGPTYRGSIRDIQLIRKGEQIASVDLYKFLMSGKNDYDAFLDAGDRIYVPLAENKVMVVGEVLRPAIFELKTGQSERLVDLMALAGGFTEFAYLEKVEISRLEKNGHRRVRYVNYQNIVEGDSTENIFLRNEDKVRVYSILDQIHKREIAIFGEINKPGIYALEDDMHLSDLILKAGSLTRQAYTLEAEVAKIDPGQQTRFLKVNLQQMHNGTNGQHDVLLEEDDQVFIRRIPKWEVGLTIEIKGEVRFPGKYSIVKDSTYLSEILQKAGGFTKQAFLQEAYVLRPSSRINFDKEFERLSEMKREEMSDLEYQYYVMRQNSTDINQIVVDFEKLIYEKDSSQDVILEAGDLIFVPRKPKVVMVSGSVAKPGGVTYASQANLDYYLSKAGGPSWDANLKKIKVIKISGEVLDDEKVKTFHPGDIIWVPRKSDTKFWSSALQAIAVTAQLASIYLIIYTSINR